MFTLRSTRLPQFPAVRLSTQALPTTRRTFRKMSSTPFFSSQPGHRTASSTHARTAINLFRSYASYGPSPAAYRSAKTVTWTLIGLNTAVFATWQYAKATRDAKLLRFMADNFWLSLDSIKAGRYHTALTAAFSHDELGHFAFNMLGLFTFGQIFAIAGIGGFHLLAAGLGSALAGSFASLYHQRSKQAPQSRNVWGSFGGDRTRTLTVERGASGLVLGLAGAATCLMPFAPMNFMFIPIPIPLFVITTGYFCYDTYFLDRGRQTGIGHAAHLGGAVFGFAYYFLELRKYGGVWPMVRRAIMRR